MLPSRTVEMCDELFAAARRPDAADTAPLNASSRPLARSDVTSSAGRRRACAARARPRYRWCGAGRSSTPRSAWASAACRPSSALVPDLARPLAHRGGSVVGPTSAVGVAACRPGVCSPTACSEWSVNFACRSCCGGGRCRPAVVGRCRSSRCRRCWPRSDVARRLRTPSVVLLRDAATRFYGRIRLWSSIGSRWPWRVGIRAEPHQPGSGAGGVPDRHARGSLAVARSGPALPRRGPPRSPPLAPLPPTSGGRSQARSAGCSAVPSYSASAWERPSTVLPRLTDVGGGWAWSAPPVSSERSGRCR